MTSIRSKCGRSGAGGGALMSALAHIHRSTGQSLIGGQMHPGMALPADQLSILPKSQVRRSRSAYAGLFVLMVLIWSTILISAVFSLRVNREACEKCPEQCLCQASPPAWG